MEEQTLRQKLERILKLQNDSINLNRNKSKLFSPPALPPRPQRPPPNPRIRKPSIKPTDEMKNAINLTENNHQHHLNNSNNTRISSSRINITPENIDDLIRKTKRGDTSHSHSNFINVFEIIQNQKQKQKEADADKGAGALTFVDPKPSSSSSSYVPKLPKKLPLKRTIDEPSNSNDSRIHQIMESREQYHFKDLELELGIVSLFDRQEEEEEELGLPSTSTSTVGASAGPPEEVQVVPADIVNLQVPITPTSTSSDSLGSPISISDEESVELLNEVDLFQQLEISESIRQRNLQSDQGRGAVWFSTETDEPEVGICRSLGQFDGEYLAGIEFVNRIGYSNGCYTDDVRYFTCESNHGRFVPIDQLLLYEDFYGETKRSATVRQSVAKRTNYRRSIAGASVNAIICVICQDSLIMSTPKDPSTEKATIATKCGHLFHNECIEEWFSTRTSEDDKLCPYCSQKVNMDADVIRIYPVQSN